MILKKTVSLPVLRLLLYIGQRSFPFFICFLNIVGNPYCRNNLCVLCLPCLDSGRQRTIIRSTLRRDRRMPARAAWTPSNATARKKSSKSPPVVGFFEDSPAECQQELPGPHQMLRLEEKKSAKKYRP
jgi:hypothetical protein